MLNILAMHDITDIPEWCVVEGTGEYPDWNKTVSHELQKKMFDASPIAHVEKVGFFSFPCYTNNSRWSPHICCSSARRICVLCLITGRLSAIWSLAEFLLSKLNFIHFLHNSHIFRVLTYPPSAHPLEEVEVEADYAINMVRWFQKAFSAAK